MKNNKAIFYYEVDYTVDNGIAYGKDPILECHSKYGFLFAEDYARAAQELADFYSTDLVSIHLACISDNGEMLSVSDRATALAFRKIFENEF